MNVNHYAGTLFYLTTITSHFAVPLTRFYDVTLFCEREEKNSSAVFKRGDNKPKC